MPIAHVHLLLDANKYEGELMAECPSCGAITLEALVSAWSKRFIVCECGLSIEIIPEHLRQLRAMAAQYQHKIDELIGGN
jgi:transcription elongation factor Elf1